MNKQFWDYLISKIPCYCFSEEHLFMFFVTIDEIKTIILCKFTVHDTQYQSMDSTLNFNLQWKNCSNSIYFCIKVIANTLKVPEGCFTLDKLMLRKNRRSTHTFEPLSGQWLPVCFMQIKANSFKQFVHLCKSISVR